mgnify:CR=1 FL=1
MIAVPALAQDADHKIVDEPLELTIHMHLPRSQGYNNVYPVEKVASEWTLVCLAYNLRRLHNLVNGAKHGAAKPKSASLGGAPELMPWQTDAVRKMASSASWWLDRLSAETTPILALRPTGS